MTEVECRIETGCCPSAPGVKCQLLGRADIDILVVNEGSDSKPRAAGLL